MSSAPQFPNMNQMLEDAISVIGGDGLPSPCEASLSRGDPAGFDPKIAYLQLYAHLHPPDTVKWSDAEASSESSSLLRYRDV